MGYVLKVKPKESAEIRCGCEKENKQGLLLDFLPKKLGKRFCYLLRWRALGDK